MTESLSSVYDATAPALVGAWVFDPVDPDGTERQYLYVDGRSEAINVRPAEIEIVGRVNPIVEYGEVSLVGLKLTIFVPFDDEHDAAVEAWRTFADNRRAICYRDNRKRIFWAALVGDLALVDGRAGTAISVSLRRVDYDEAVA